MEDEEDATVLYRRERRSPQMQAHCQDSKLVSSRQPDCVTRHVSHGAGCCAPKLQPAILTAIHVYSTTKR